MPETPPATSRCWKSMAGTTTRFLFPRPAAVRGFSSSRWAIRRSAFRPSGWTSRGLKRFQMPRGIWNLFNPREVQPEGRKADRLMAQREEEKPRTAAGLGNKKRVVVPAIDFQHLDVAGGLSGIVVGRNHVERGRGGFPDGKVVVARATVFVAGQRRPGGVPPHRAAVRSRRGVDIQGKRVRRFPGGGHLPDVLRYRPIVEADVGVGTEHFLDRKSTRLNSSHRCIS